MLCLRHPKMCFAFLTVMLHCWLTPFCWAALQPLTYFCLAHSNPGAKLGIFFCWILCHCWLPRAPMDLCKASCTSRKSTASLSAVWSANLPKMHSYIQITDKSWRGLALELSLWGTQLSDWLPTRCTSIHYELTSSAVQSVIIHVTWTCWTISPKGCHKLTASKTLLKYWKITVTPILSFTSWVTLL